MLVIIVFCIIIVVFVRFSIGHDRDKKLLETVSRLNRATRADASYSPAMAIETVSRRSRGTRAERYLVLNLLKAGISAEEIFHDLYIKKFNGTFSQIDLVVITEVGIIVFEVKDYSGWIFGNGYHQQWTQLLAYGKQKYRFYNPVKQNNNHIAVLRQKIGNFAKVPFYSIIVFDGDCELRDIKFIPKGTFIAKPERILDVIVNILNNNEIVNYRNKDKIVKLLEESVNNGENTEIRIQHITNVKDILGEDRVFK